jgi:hypothetical protein
VISRNKKLIQDEIKRIFNSGNACNHSVHNLLSSRLLLKNGKVRIHNIIILPVVLYRCERWSLTLREEHTLRVFETMVLRRIFGLKRDEVMGGLRKLHNEELHDFYISPSIIRIIKLRRMRWAGHVARMGEKRNVYRLLVGKLEGKIPLRRPRHRWVDNIKMDLVEIGLGGVDVCGSGYVQAESSSECGNEPSGSIKCWKTAEWLHNLWPLEWCSGSQT